MPPASDRPAGPVAVPPSEDGPIHDPVLDTDVLLTERAGPMLVAALEGIAEVVRWRRSQVRHVPGRQLVVRYAVEVRWPDARESVETVVAEQADGPAPEGVAVLVGPSGRQIWLWRYPFDPHLPGLAPAAHPHRVAELLDRLGIGVGPVRVLPLTYRPSRRAVLEVVRAGRGGGGDHRLFVKVLPRTRAARVAQVHEDVARAVRVPRVLAADLDAGTLVLDEVPGDSLRTLLCDPHAVLPEPRALAAIHSRLATVATSLERPPSRPFDVTRGADAIRAMLPSEADRIDRVAEAAHTAVDGGGEGDSALVTVHGDLHEAQVLVGPDGRLGIVDLDGTGPGRLVVDVATMLAHLHLLARWHPTTALRTHRFAEAYLREVATLVDPARARRRAAGVMLGLAAAAVSGTVDGSGQDAEARARLALAEALAADEPERQRG